MKLKNKTKKAFLSEKITKAFLSEKITKHNLNITPIIAYNSQKINNDYCLLLYFEGNPLDINYLSISTWNRNKFIDFYVITTDEWYDEWSKFCKFYNNIKLIKSKPLIELYLENNILNQRSYNKIKGAPARRIGGLRPFMFSFFDFVNNYKNFGWIDHDVVLNPSFDPSKYVTENTCYKFRKDCGQLNFIKHAKSDASLNDYIRKRKTCFRFEESHYQRSIKWTTIEGGLWVGDREHLPDNSKFIVTDRLMFNGEELIFFTPQYYDNINFEIDKQNINGNMLIEIAKDRSINVKKTKEKTEFKISFCTTCCNRLFQLEQTMPKNIKIIHDNNMQMCLVNYNSDDDLDNYVKSNYQKYIKCGTLKYFHTTEPQKFDMSKAKHMAHSLGDGEYLYNLDADGFITQDEINYINELKNVKAYHNFSRQIGNRKRLESYGRIMIRKDLYKEIGGYDIRLLAMGHQDSDILNKCKKYNIHTNTNYYLDPISNFRGKRIKGKFRDKVKGYENADVAAIKQYNLKICKENCSNPINGTIGDII